MNTPALELVDVTKEYGARRILRGVTGRVAAGEIVGLVGLNGTGKTTLIKSILGMLSLSRGAISVFGVRCYELAARQQLAYLPERFTPPAHVTGAEFLRYASGLHGLPFDARRAAGVAQALDLGGQAWDQPVKWYSKGMTQKLGLAAAVLSDKPLLILDEPMSGLDPRARLQLKEVLSGLLEAGRTVFLATHLLADVQALCTRIWVLYDGELIFDETPKTFADRYGNTDLDRAFVHCIDARKGVSAVSAAT